MLQNWLFKCFEALVTNENCIDKKFWECCCHTLQDPPFSVQSKNSKTEICKSTS